MYRPLRHINLFFLLSSLIFSAGSCKNSKEPDTAISADPKIANLKLPAGFHADHLYSPGINNQGSWVAMTFDNKGRMIAADQYGNLYRLTIPPVGSDTNQQKIKVDSIVLQLPGDTSKYNRRIGYAHGLLYAFNSLYVMVNDEGDDSTKTR